MTAAAPVHLPDSPPSEAFLRLVPREFARRHLILSSGREGDAELLGVAQTTPALAVHNVSVRLGTACRAIITDAEHIAAAIDRWYGLNSPTGAEPTSDAGVDIERLVADSEQDLLSTEGKGPIIQLVDALLFEAVRRGASDLHVQPLSASTLVRYRVDGVLHDAHELPPRAALAVISRVKVMSRMDVAERRLAQDGRATVRLGHGATSRTIDLRVSTLPTSYGERLVVRLLDTVRAAHLFDFASLGMPAACERAFLDRAGRANGIILATGPTGSGKTTTLYATLRWIATREVAAGTARTLNILTVEDPIEYELSASGLAVSQSQVNTKKGISIATGLRHILRQDPDVIMVGEVRDEETARLAVQASLTGHLVLSTLHTNDAVGAIVRLLDLRVEPYLVASALSAVIAQRLVRLLHPTCGGSGCAVCLGSGFKGRRGIFELVPIDNELRTLILARAAPAECRAQAASTGTRFLQEEGARLVADGLTTPGEVGRVIRGVE